MAHQQPQYHSIISDRYTDVDRLNFAEYVRALAEVVADPDSDTPLTIGVFGPWGSGKTSLMRMIERSLRTGPVAERYPEAQSYPIVWFDAWKYEREDALWRALVLRVLHTVRQLPAPADPAHQKALEKQFDDLEQSLYRVVEREELGKVEIQWGEVAKGAGKTLVHLGLNMIPGVGAVLPKLLEKSQEQLASDDMQHLFDGIRRERQKVHRDHIQSIEQFQHEFERLIQTVLTPHRRRLVVFVDDLDRCLPEKAIEVLEAIKLFMDVPGCLFVLGLDRDVIARGIEMKYREHFRAGEDRPFAIDGSKYLEKIIQVPFRIPPIEPGVMGSFVRNMMPEALADCAKVFAAGMGESPRQIKRAVNSFLLLWRLAANAGLRAILMAKIVALQQSEPNLYELLRDLPYLLRDLEEHYRQRELPEAEMRKLIDAGDESRLKRRLDDLAPALRPFAGSAAVRRILLTHNALEDERFHPLPAEELIRYFTLARRTEAPISDSPSRERRPAPSHTPLIEPEMASIPAGVFAMGTSEGQATALRRMGLSHESLKTEMPRREARLSAFSIGKYPITNAEYVPFIQATGHRQPDHWQTVAQEGKSAHPVVNVSWEDARAFCVWLSQETGKRYALPTEAQWEYACRAGADTIYPFGDNPGGLEEYAWFEANSKGETHPVGDRRPNAWDIYDMLGNVWEWCADAFLADAYAGRKTLATIDPLVTEGMYRTLRGGSFINAPQDVRCAARGSDYPFIRIERVGFRVVLPPNDPATPSTKNAR